MCVGCVRNKVIHLDNFPDDYPKDMMMCCACTWSYYHHLGIPKPIEADIIRASSLYHLKGFLEEWWNRFGDNIEKVMRIQ